MKNSVHSVGKSGALSSGHALPMWQVPVSFIESCARRMLAGNLPKPDRETPYPIHNWRGGLGDAKFIRDRFGHAMKHMAKLGNGLVDEIDDTQGNIDGIAWFVAFINEAQRLHPEAVAEAFYNVSRGEVYE